MQLLLDTHALIWFFNGDTALSRTAQNLIEAPAADCWVSIVSIWEMGIKTSMGKLQLRGELAEIEGFLAASGINLLPITFAHVVRLQSLPFHHRDPFDRLLIAQALSEKLTLLTQDGAFDAYEMPVLW